VEEIIKTIMGAVAMGGSEALAVVGWGLYVLERYYIAPKREAMHREDLKAFSEEYKAVTGETNTIITQFMVLLEVIKDRLRRGDN
jgi:hypothetical protein